MNNLFRRRATSSAASPNSGSTGPSPISPSGSATSGDHSNPHPVGSSTGSASSGVKGHSQPAGSDDKGKRPPTATATATSSSNNNGTGSTDTDGTSGMFECNICLETASNPVVTLCGHLYCWPCIHKWMTSDRSASAGCPVCKAGVDRGKCIPIYCRGRETIDPRTTTTAGDPNEDMPDRPSGQRPPQQPRFRFGGYGSGGFPFQQAFGFGGNGMRGGGGGGGVQFTTGFGIPFFGLQFNYPEPLADEDITPEQAFRQTVARTFLIFGLFILISLLLY